MSSISSTLNDNIGRFITPIFLHAGIIHLALNMLAQMMISAQVEREMGSVGFFILYFAAGIFGYVKPDSRNPISDSEFLYQ